MKAPKVRRFGTRTRTIVVAGVLAMLTPAVATAHGALKSSSPSAGAHLGTAPRAIRLDFNETVELAFTSIALLGPDSTRVLLDSVRAVPDSRRAVVAAIHGALAAGTYTIVWQMAGADGHPVRGQFRFVIAPGASGLGAGSAPESPEQGLPRDQGVAPGQTPTPTTHHDVTAMPGTPGSAQFDAESLGYVAIRWAQFMALLTVIGAIAFQFVVLGGLRRKQQSPSSMLVDARDRAAALALWASLALAATVILRLYAQSFAMHGEASALDAFLIASMLGKTVWGSGWLAQAAGVVVAIVGFARARRGLQGGWTIGAFGTAVLAFTPALSGHAASAPQLTGLAVLADGLHVMGAGGWLGSLLMVVAAGIPAALRLAEGERGPAVADLVNAFSPSALVFAGLAASTGVFAAWLHLGAVPALWQTPYGRTLLLKLGVLSLVAGTGAYNWLRVKPALGGPGGGPRIRRSAVVELGVGLVVLIVTAVLVATPTAMDASAITASDTNMPTRYAPAPQ